MNNTVKPIPGLIIILAIIAVAALVIGRMTNAPLGGVPTGPGVGNGCHDCLHKAMEAEKKKGIRNEKEMVKEAIQSTLRKGAVTHGAGAHPGVGGKSQT